MGSAFFCGYDDFHELARAAFERAGSSWSAVLTIPHDGFKYRPLNGLATVLWWRWGGFDAGLYRTRNIVMHLFGVGITYAIGILVTRSRVTAAMGALLFGVHPLANQSVNGAVWTNTTAHAIGLASTLWMLRACVTGSRLYLSGGAVAGLVAVLFYDVAIVYVCVSLVLTSALSSGARSRMGAMLAAQVGVLLLYALLRALTVPQSYQLVGGAAVGVGSMVRNAAVYAGALLNPFDPVLLHVLLGVPLPVALVDLIGLVRGGRVLGIMVVAVGSLLFLVLGWKLIGWPMYRRSSIAVMLRTCRGSHCSRRVVLALAGSVAVSFLPVLVLSGHVSETYVYGALPFWSLLIAYVLGALDVRMQCVLLLGAVIVCASSTVARNMLIVRCGDTAERILAMLPPVDPAVWSLTFANEPDHMPASRYGLYGYRGIDCVGSGEMAERGITAAIQLHDGKAFRSGKVVPPATMQAECAVTRPASHFWVRNDGSLRDCLVGNRE